MIKLKRNEYDALEFVAEVYGGVGGGRFNERNTSIWRDMMDDEVPWCIFGMAEFAGMHTDNQRSLRKAGLTAWFNDYIILKGNRTKRISWKEYVKRGNIVRGTK